MTARRFSNAGFFTVRYDAKSAIRFSTVLRQLERSSWTFPHASAAVSCVQPDELAADPRLR